MSGLLITGAAGQVGTALLRLRPDALGIVNTDNPIPEDVLAEIRQIPAIRNAQVVRL